MSRSKAGAIITNSRYSIICKSGRGPHRWMPWPFQTVPPRFWLGLKSALHPHPFSGIMHLFEPGPPSGNAEISSLVRRRRRQPSTATIISGTASRNSALCRPDTGASQAENAFFTHSPWQFFSSLIPENGGQAIARRPQRPQIPDLE